MPARGGHLPGVLPPPLLWALSMARRRTAPSAATAEKEGGEWGWVGWLPVRSAARFAQWECVCREEDEGEGEGRRPHAEDNDNGAYHNCGVGPTTGSLAHTSSTRYGGRVEPGGGGLGPCPWARQQTRVSPSLSLSLSRAAVRGLGRAHLGRRRRHRRAGVGP